MDPLAGEGEGDAAAEFGDAAYFSKPNPAVGYIINDWRLSGVFNAQSGTPVGVNTGYSLTCPESSYRPKGGTSVGQGRWFSGDESCWQGLPQWGLGYLSGTTAKVRNPTTPNLDLSLAKSTPIHDNLVFTLAANRQIPHAGH